MGSCPSRKRRVQPAGPKVPNAQKDTNPSKKPDDRTTETGDKPSGAEKPTTQDGSSSPGKPETTLDTTSSNVGGSSNRPGKRSESVSSEEHVLSDTEEEEGESSKVLEYTPPKKLPTYRVEDYFWDHKKELIPDYSRMTDLDDRATEVPETLNNQPQELVNYLTENLTSDLEKTRVLIRWISENIAYVENPLGNNFTVENILQTRLTNCQGYSNLMEDFCRLAGVDCKTISGLSKGAGYSPGYVFKTDGSEVGHAWNKVKIQDQWYLCDPTWAAGCSNKYGRFEKQWKEDWFLTHPDAFLSTHLPFNSQQGIFDSEQLVDNPIYSVAEWSDGMKTEPLTHAYNIRPITHMQPVLEVQSAQLTIKYINPLNHVMKQWTELKQDQPAKSHENQVMLYTVDEEVRVNIRLPEKGSYSLKILGKIITPDWPNENGIKSPVVCLFWYKMYFRSEGSFIPGTGAEWGLTPQYQAAGVKLLAPKSSVIQAKTGICQIQMRLPTRGVLPNFHRLYHPNATTDELRKCVYGEKKDNKATYHIRCPFPGEYRFEILYKPAPHAGTGGYYTGAAFLIECQKPAQDPYCYTDSEQLGGPMVNFYTEFGLSTTHSSSTVAVHNGEAELFIKESLTKKLSLFAHLSSRDGTYTVVQRKTMDDVTTLCIKPEGKGFYFLKIYAGLETSSTCTQVALYYVDA